MYKHTQVLRDSGLEVRGPSVQHIEAVRQEELRRLDTIRAVPRPTFLITYGPPASGKGACASRFFDVATERNEFDRNNYYAINIDSIVEQLDAAHLVKENADNYWLFRPAANKIGDDLLQHGLATQKPLVFETTGNSVDSGWYQSAILGPAKANHYYILVAYPLVPVDTLITRAKERAKEIGRLPSEESIRTAARNAAVNLAKLVSVVDSVVVFDNSGADKCRYEILDCIDQRCEAKCESSLEGEACVARCSEILEMIRKKFGVALTVPCGVEQNLTKQ